MDYKRTLAVAAAVALACVLGFALVYEFVYCRLLNAPPKIGRVYQQLWGYSNVSTDKMMPAMKMNYTIVLSSGPVVVDSIVTVCKWNGLPVARLEVSFGGSEPNVTEGNTTWTGLMEDSTEKSFDFKLALSNDGAYEIMSAVNTTALTGGSQEGIHLTYNIVIKDGNIVKVADENGVDLIPSA